MATTRIGDVNIYVTSPSGTVSQVMDNTGGDKDFDQRLASSNRRHFAANRRRHLVGAGGRRRPATS